MTDQANEAGSLALIFSNTRKNRRAANLVDVSKAIKLITEKHGVDETAKMVGLSREMIREFLNILDLPEEILNYVRERKIDSIDIIRRVRSLLHYGVHTKDVLEYFKTNPKPKTEDFRDIESLIKRTHISLFEATEIINAAKKRTEHVFILTLDDETYRKLKGKAKKDGTNVSSLVKNLIQIEVNKEVG